MRKMGQFFVLAPFHVRPKNTENRLFSVENSRISLNINKQLKPYEEKESHISAYLFAGCTSTEFSCKFACHRDYKLVSVIQLAYFHQAEIIRKAYLHLCCHNGKSIMHMYISNIDNNNLLK